MKIAAAALMAMVFSTAGAETTPRTGNKAQEAPPRPDDVICTYQSEAGSHLKKRVCATRAARERKAQADQDRVKRVQQQNGGAAAQ